MRQQALDMVHELARRDSRVVFIGSDLGPGVLEAMRQEFPDRFFMEGVSEANIIGMAAGLAMDGYIPYVNTIATFLTRRCYEQLAIDLCLHNLPVRLISNGGGMVYAPLGPTHLATEDLAIVRALPNMSVVAPADETEMIRMMGASLDLPGPLYIRVGKGNEPVVTGHIPGFTFGKAVELRSGRDVVLISTGAQTGQTLKAADLLAETGVDAGLLHLPTVKPLDRDAVLSAAVGTALLVSVEEHTLIGGLGSAVADLLADAGVLKPLLRLGLPDAYPTGYGSQEYLLGQAGLLPAQIAAQVQERLAILS
ncbi:transketolase family protein [Azospirillum sp. B4]|uniref:transketolase family protein n=1 Tax=Azospirillum sp. B4 TaxID=95605 RepID=UPI00034C9A3C|nr:transketolase C-terminal domain-containing protein [Azospirillum sp. B4]